MLPYQEGRSCPKCAHKDNKGVDGRVWSALDVAYCPGDTFDCLYELPAGESPVEHLHYHCQRCKFSFTTACAV